MRSTIDEVEVRLAVNSPKNGIGQLEHIDISDERLWIELAQGQLDRLRGAQMTAPDRRRQHKHPSRHESPPAGLGRARDANATVDQTPGVRILSRLAFEPAP